MEEKCQVRGCDRPVNAKGLCHAHYQQKRKGHPFGPVKEIIRRIPKYDSRQKCKVRGCDRKPLARDLCQMHYRQWYRKEHEAHADQA